MLVEVAHATLERLLADTERGVDILSVRLVVERTESVLASLQILQQLVAERRDAFFSEISLELQIDLPVRSHLFHVGFQFVAGVKRLEYLVVEDQSPVFTVDDGFHAQVGFLMYEDVDFFS